MQVGINDFINSHYDVMFRGDGAIPDHFDDVEEFLLDDHHDIEGYSAVNSLFVNTFSNAGDAVLTEGVPSMQKVTSDQVAMTAYLTTQAPIYGWDEDINKKLSQFPGVEELNRVRTQMEVLKRKLLDPKDSEDKLELFGKLTQVAVKVRDLQKTVHIDEESVNKIVEETFPARTESMKGSLTKVKPISKRTFLFAGGAHLHENPYEQLPSSYYYQGKGPASLPLGDFIAFLKPRNVVVLRPKPDKVMELGQEREELMLAISMALAQLEGRKLV